MIYIDKKRHIQDLNPNLPDPEDQPSPASYLHHPAFLSPHMEVFSVVISRRAPLVNLVCTRSLKSFCSHTRGNGDTDITMTCHLQEGELSSEACIRCLLSRVLDLKVTGVLTSCSDDPFRPGYLLGPMALCQRC